MMNTFKPVMSQNHSTMISVFHAFSPSEGPKTVFVLSWRVKISFWLHNLQSSIRYGAICRGKELLASKQIISAGDEWKKRERNRERKKAWQEWLRENNEYCHQYLLWSSMVLRISQLIRVIRRENRGHEKIATRRRATDLRSHPTAFMGRNLRFVWVGGSKSLKGCGAGALQVLIMIAGTSWKWLKDD